MSSLADNCPNTPSGTSGPGRATSAEASDALGELVGGLTHDFNNLFGLIIGNLELLRDPQTNPQESLDFSRDALEAAMRGTELTRDLVAFAQRQRLDPRPIDLNELVTTTATALGVSLGARIEIALDLADDIWPVIADPAQLEAALSTLAMTAAGAIPERGRITIATANRKSDGTVDLAAGDYATIAQTDSGPGIPPELIDRFFEPFATKGRTRGNGLRLGAIFGFMKQSRGHITATNGSGAGTTFRLHLPRAGAAAESEVRRARPAESKGKTVLVVEDDAAMRQLAVRHLTALGYGVVEAGNAAVAIATLETEPAIDLLFSDVVMPGEMDGLALAGMVVRRWPKVKIIITSEVDLAKIGDDEFGIHIRLLTKPYRKDDLARTLHEVLNIGDTAGQRDEPHERGDLAWH
jgi:two-component system, cell cycle sensor histidine kinase and response regulator CckA